MPKKSGKNRTKEALAAATAPDPNTYEGQVKLQLQTLSAPLREQLLDIDKKIADVQATLSDLRKAKVDITLILNKLDPSRVSTSGNGKNGRGSSNAEYHANLLVKKADRVAELLTTNPEQFPEGFTANMLAQTLTDQVQKGLSTKSAAQVLEILRDRNVVRADRVTRGGGMNFQLVGKAD